MSDTFTCATSETLGPAAYMAVRIVRCPRFFGASTISLQPHQCCPRCLPSSEDQRPVLRERKVRESHHHAGGYLFDHWHCRSPQLEPLHIHRCRTQGTLPH